MKDKKYVPLPHFARQLWPDEKKFKWWVKYYIERNHYELKPIGVEGDKIVCVRREEDESYTRTVED
jgi:hypothetical protein